ncbi:flavodoxin [Collinsella tanakaei]|uniref:flavodoxin n=1 Tax=Collinsella tanakaei TaxID=626935 RepID=UPI00195AB8FB|nr:flavodoxin [Collinsella tanakaei]MBM6755522.1 flavodoxin [Collinsella tanakaei]
MSKVAVVFWSGTGNTETMANAVAEGAAAKGAEVETVQAADFSAAMAPDFDAIAFGCPAMGSEELEDGEFQPMWDDVKPELDGKKIALFGSYDWGTGEWMDTWREDAEDAGATVVDTVIANNEPDDEALAACSELAGQLL